jgi:hypothetical protein
MGNRILFLIIIILILWFLLSSTGKNMLNNIKGVLTGGN